MEAIHRELDELDASTRELGAGVAELEAMGLESLRARVAQGEIASSQLAQARARIATLEGRLAALGRAEREKVS